MPKFALKVLCVDGVSCNFVKSTLMKDFQIKDAKKIDDFDHIVIRDFTSIEDAQKVARILIDDNPNNILDIAIAVARA